MDLDDDSLCSQSTSLLERHALLEEIYNQLAQFPIPPPVDLSDLLDIVFYSSELGMNEPAPLLPRFAGVNPDKWICYAERFFHYYAIYGADRFPYVSDCFCDEAANWFSHFQITEWSEFIVSLVQRFGYSRNGQVTYALQSTNIASAHKVFDEMSTGSENEIENNIHETIDEEVLDIQTASMVDVTKSLGVQNAQMDVLASNIVIASVPPSITAVLANDSAENDMVEIKDWDVVDSCVIKHKKVRLFSFGSIVNNILSAQFVIIDSLVIHAFTWKPGIIIPLARGLMGQDGPAPILDTNAKVITDFYKVVVGLKRSGTHKNEGRKVQNGSNILRYSVPVGVVSFVDIATCNELLVAPRKARMKSEFRNVLVKCQETIKNFSVDVPGYNVCTHAFGNWGALETSFHPFRELKEHGVLLGLNSYTYNSLLQSFCFSVKVHDALSVWEEMTSSGHAPVDFTYGVIIQARCRCYSLNDAPTIFSDLPHNGFHLDTNVYTFVLDGFLKSRTLMEACQLFENMVDDSVWASCCSYNILMDGFFKNRRDHAAYALFGDLQQKRQFVVGVTYLPHVLLICREVMIEDAWELVGEMDSRGFVADFVTLTHPLVAISTESCMKLTDKRLEHFKNGDLMPDMIEGTANMEDPKIRKTDFTTMFKKNDFIEIMSFITSHESSSLSKESIAQGSSSPYMDPLTDEANSHNQLLMSSKGKCGQAKCVVSFDVNMVNTYFSIYINKGKLSLPCILFDIMPDLDIDSVSCTYTSLMSSWVTTGYSHEAYGVLSNSEENVSSVDVATYNLRTQVLGKLGQADLANIYSSVGSLDGANGIQLGLQQWEIWTPSGCRSFGASSFHQFFKGLPNSTFAGILISIDLVDLIVAKFISQKMQGKLGDQIVSFTTLSHCVHTRATLVMETPSDEPANLKEFNMFALVAVFIVDGLDPVITSFAALYGHKPPTIAHYLFHSSGRAANLAEIFNRLLRLLYLHLEDKVNLKRGSNVMNGQAQVGNPITCKSPPAHYIKREELLSLGQEDY